MTTTRCLLAILALSSITGLAGCERNQEQLTPAAKTEEGRKTAEEYPSTRNTENPDPSIGGRNSATSRPEAHPDAPEKPDRAPESTAGR